MNDFFVNLNEYSTKKQKVFRTLIFGGLLFIGVMILSFLLLWFFNKAAEYLVATITVYLIIYFYFAWFSFKTKLYLKADKSCITIKFGIRNSSKDIILWDTIRKVRIGPTYIAFYKKSGRRRRYMLGWLPYAKVIEIKDNLIALLDSIGVDYEVVDFIRYQDKVER